MAIKAITPKELQGMDLDSYTKRAQQMLNKMTGQDGKSDSLKFIFIDNYDFEKTSVLEEQPVFIAGTDLGKIWKEQDILKLGKAGYKQDIMYGSCRVIEGALHMFDLEGGSIMSKDLDLKFKEFLKDMQKASVFKGWKFHEGSLPVNLDEKSEDLSDRAEDGKAADNERIRLANEIPKLWENLAKIYAKAEKLPELTEKDFDTSMFEEKRKIYQELLDASGEVRSDLMDVGKFYFRLIA